MRDVFHLEMRIIWFDEVFQLQSKVVRREYVRIRSKSIPDMEMLISIHPDAEPLEDEDRFIYNAIQRYPLIVRRVGLITKDWLVTISKRGRAFGAMSLVGVEVLKSVEMSLDGPDRILTPFHVGDVDERWCLDTKHRRGPYAYYFWSQRLQVLSADAAMIEIWSRRSMTWRLGGKWSDGPAKSFFAMPCSYEKLVESQPSNQIVDVVEPMVGGDSVIIIYDPETNKRLGSWLTTLRKDPESLFDGQNPRNILFGTTEKRKQEFESNKEYLKFHKEFLGHGTIAIVDYKIFTDYAVSLNKDTTAEHLF